MHDRQKDFYMARIANATNNTEAVGWQDESKAHRRYKLVADKIATSGPYEMKSVVDFGCGVGGLCPVLRENVPDVFYIGMDAMKEYVDFAQNKHFQYQFFHVENAIDALPILRKRSIDIAACVGTFSLKLGMSDIEYAAYTYGSISYLMDEVHTLILTGFHTAVDFRHPDLYYQDLNDLMVFCYSHGWKLELDNSISKYDFMATISKR